MPTYIGLYEHTTDGVEQIADAPDRIEAGRELVESLGGTVRGFYHTTGEYDFVSVLEFPDHEAATAAKLRLEESGTTRAELHRALPAEEFTALVEED